MLFYNLKIAFFFKEICQMIFAALTRLVKFHRYIDSCSYTVIVNHNNESTLSAVAGLYISVHAEEQN